LNRETIQDLTEQEGEQVVGGIRGTSANPNACARGSGQQGLWIKRQPHRLLGPGRSGRRLTALCPRCRGRGLLLSAVARPGGTRVGGSCTVTIIRRSRRRCRDDRGGYSR